MGGYLRVSMERTSGSFLPAYERPVIIVSFLFSSFSQSLHFLCFFKKTCPDGMEPCFCVAWRTADVGPHEQDCQRGLEILGRKNQRPPGSRVKICPRYLIYLRGGRRVFYRFLYLTLFFRAAFIN